MAEKAYPRIVVHRTWQDWQTRMVPWREYHWIYYEAENIAVCDGWDSGDLEPIRADAERFNALLKNPVPIEVRE